MIDTVLRQNESLLCVRLLGNPVGVQSNRVVIVSGFSRKLDLVASWSGCDSVVAALESCFLPAAATCSDAVVPATLKSLWSFFADVVVGRNRRLLNVVATCSDAVVLVYVVDAVNFPCCCRRRGEPSTAARWSVPWVVLFFCPRCSVHYHSFSS